MFRDSGVYFLNPISLRVYESHLEAIAKSLYVSRAGGGWAAQRMALSRTPAPLHQNPEEPHRSLPVPHHSSNVQQGPAAATSPGSDVFGMLWDAVGEQGSSKCWPWTHSFIYSIFR